MDKPLIFLADESVEHSLVLHLRNQGYEVAAISEDSPSIADEDVLFRAYTEGRVLLTNDKDFGDLIFLNKLQHRGVVLFRFKNEHGEEKVKAFQKLLEKYIDKLADNFIVIDESKVRIRA